jgi:hypothetical protein
MMGRSWRVRSGELVLAAANTESHEEDGLLVVVLRDVNMRLVRSARCRSTPVHVCCRMSVMAVAPHLHSIDPIRHLTQLRISRVACSASQHAGDQADSIRAIAALKVT